MAPRKTPGVYPRGEIDPDAKIIAVYYYPKADGTPYGMVKRTENKRFPQFHYEQISKLPDTNDDRNWIAGQPNGPKIPYNFPRIARATADTPLHINEGEKDADTLIDLGLLATTCASSATGWTDDVSRPLARFEVIYIHADNDQAGELFAKTVIASLNRCGHDGLKIIVRYRELEEGDDVSDFVGDTSQMNSAQISERRVALEDHIEKNGETWIRPNVPVITLTEDNFAKAIDDTEDALVVSKDRHNIMFRGGSLVRPIWEEKKNSEGGKTHVHQFHAMCATGLADQVTKYAARYEKPKGNKIVPTLPPHSVMEGLLARPYSKLPRAKGVISCPTIRPDGSILDQEGYDEATGLFLGYMGYTLKVPKVRDFSSMPEEEAKKVALEVLGHFKKLFAEFPFASLLHFAVAMSAVLSAVCRGAFPCCPMHLFVAPCAGTGKSYLVDVISTIATGQECPVITWSSNQEENEKRLGSLLIEGAQIFSLDNLASNINSDLLCQMIERPSIKIRVLGTNKMPICENNGLVFGTGNNIWPIGDMVRRTLVCVLDALMENPEMKHFDGNPMKLINENRGLYVWAALTMVRAYIQTCVHRGKRVRVHPIASFGEWSMFVRETLIWLGLPDIWDSAEEAKKEDTTKDFNRQFVTIWAQDKVLKLNQKYTVKKLISLAQETGPGGMSVTDDDEDSLFDLFAQHCGDGRVINPTSLGNRLRGMRGQIVGCYRLSAFDDSKHGNRWHLEKLEAFDAPESERAPE